jgi:exopolysaccharide biosynthesis polyprenyl glycosylphosphotransferase
LEPLLGAEGRGQHIVATIDDVVRDPAASMGASLLDDGPKTVSLANTKKKSSRPYVTDREHAIVLVCVDFLATCLAVPLALLLLAAISTVPSNSLGHFATNAADNSFFPLAVIIALAASGSYRSTRRALQPSTFTELKDLTFAIGVGCVLLLTLGIISHALFMTSELSSTQLIAAVVVASILVPAGRAAVRAWVQTFTVTRIVLVGSGPLAERLAIHLRLHKGMQMVGRVVDSTETEPGTIGTVVDLPRICEELDVDRIIISADRNSPESIAAYRAVQEGVHIAVVPRHYELISWRAKLTELSGLPMLEFAPPHMSAWDRGVKRAFDIVVSIVTLILLSPLLLAIALVVRLTSKGPALFRQKRLGRGRRPFTINKFRTMIQVTTASSLQPAPDCKPAGTDAHRAAPLWEARNKPSEVHRITRVGSFLRRTGLDELPQLVNVLAGHMSIVGPRPFVSHESDESDDWTARRFEVRPGITGLWQVSGRNELSGEDLRQLDYLYVISWSMSWDLKIIFDTPRAMIRGLGAY